MLELCSYYFTTI